MPVQVVPVGHLTVQVAPMGHWPVQVVPVGYLPVQVVPMGYSPVQILPLGHWPVNSQLVHIARHRSRKPYVEWMWCTWETWPPLRHSRRERSPAHAPCTLSRRAGGETSEGTGVAGCTSCRSRTDARGRSLSAGDWMTPPTLRAKVCHREKRCPLRISLVMEGMSENLDPC